MSQVWPKLPVESWESTRDTLTLWLQVVGKVQIERTPLLSHWWNAPLYLTAEGLTTSLMPAESGRSFTVDFDFLGHRVDIKTTHGQQAGFALEPMTVQDFYNRFMGELDGLNLSTHVWPMPVEIPDAIPFTEDTVHKSYDAAAVTDFWRILVESERVFDVFRARFLGKSSRVHFFWGSFDLAATRFSGRTAPPHPGVAPNLGRHVMREAYSHEVSSAGYWPGGEGEGVYYSYAYPEPDRFRDADVGTDARFDDELGEYVLPYTAVRTAKDPDAKLLEFLQRTYEAAADNANWDRAELERNPTSATKEPGAHP